MPRGSSSALLSWLLVPVAAMLVQSALSLPRQPYTGLLVRGGEVASVVPGSPGERAGLARGDRIVGPPAGPQSPLRGDPLTYAVPGRPLALERIRGGERGWVWLVPEPQPPGERRMMAVLLTVASGFVLLGGWVWSERRDRLTRVFFLLCLCFAWLLPPLRRWSAVVPELTDRLIVAAIEAYLPALFVHFFALFPESRARGRLRGWVSAAYVIASLLAVPALALVALEAYGVTAGPQIDDLAQAALGIWFAIGLLSALALFVDSYRRAGSPDSRRRLRVALIGTLLGAAPLAALIALRNVSPVTAVPGERWAVVMTLLVPASFAWATAVHRIFDFRVALRAMLVTLWLGLAGVAVYAGAEWLIATGWPDLSARFAGGALAFVALLGAAAGPAVPWLASLSARVVPGEGGISLSGWISSRSAPTPDRPADAAIDAMLVEASEAVAGFLRLDGCIALAIGDDGVKPVAGSPSGRLSEPGPGLRLRATQLSRSGVQSIEEAALDGGDREALELAGVSWLLPVDADPVRAVLLLGRRIAGTWLSRRETVELERFAQHLSVALENAALRREASSRGALDRELREAGALQAHLLPRHAPLHPTLDCAAAALSSESVGGDYYDFIEGPDRDFTLAVGDAAGKGVPAALLLAQVQARFRSQARQGLMPGQLLSALNQELVGLDQPEKFVGLLCARVEVRHARVWIANGGLTPPLVRRADGSFVEIMSGGLLLGVSPEARYADVRLDLGAGDVLVVYTDGLSEARGGEELFGSERVREVLDRNAWRRSSDILEALLEAVRRFADRPLDDLTVLVLKQLTETARNRPSAQQNALKGASPGADAKA